MTGMPMDPEARLDESLAAISRLRTSVSVEDRVMANVRAEAARQPARFKMSRRQKVLLAAAAAFGTVAEAALCIGAAVAAWRLADLALLPSLTLSGGFGSTALLALQSALGIALVLGEAIVTVVNGLALLLPSAGVLAALFVGLLSFLTFVAVQRDLRRSPAIARGRQ
jgi:hypothetical protein